MALSKPGVRGPSSRLRSGERFARVQSPIATADGVPEDPDDNGTDGRLTGWSGCPRVFAAVPPPRRPARTGRFGNPNRGLPARVLGHPVLMWIGLISYGLLLWHGTVAVMLGSPRRRRGLLDGADRRRSCIAVPLAMPQLLLRRAAADEAEVPAAARGPARAGRGAAMADAGRRSEPGDRRGARDAWTSRAAMRRAMFLSQDGVVALPDAARARRGRRSSSPSLEEDRSLAELLPDLTDGRLRRAAGRACTASSRTGWLAEPARASSPTTTVLRWTDAGRAAMAASARPLPRARRVARRLRRAPRADAWTRPWEAGAGRALRRAASRGSRRERGACRRASRRARRAHLDGALVVPAMLWLHETGRLGERGPDLPAGELGEAMARLLGGARLDRRGRTSWTESGAAGAAPSPSTSAASPPTCRCSRACPSSTAASSTSSPTPARRAASGTSTGTLNLRISAAAHRRYFADTDAALPRALRPRAARRAAALHRRHGLRRRQLARPSAPR